jgi:sulfur-oxidizing protein SoxY
MVGRCFGLLFLLVCGLPDAAADVWESLLEPHYFAGRKIEDGAAVLALGAPYRAEDAAYTPVTITAKIPQTAQRYVETLYLFVDDNPEPLAGVFHLTPALGRADLALRLRVNAYTHIRAVAVTNDGALYMVARFVKALAGCNAELRDDPHAALRSLGRMRLRLLEAPDEEYGAIAELVVSHPNLTGLQRDPRTGSIPPAWYVRSIRVTLDGAPLLSAETGIAISRDPSFRFFVRPHRGGRLEAEIVDSKGRAWREVFGVDG